MKIFIETDRLLLREIVPTDAANLFKLDSDPLVNRYLGNKPIKTLQESADIITYIRQQYDTNGIGRWAVIEKESGAFIGWSGLKLEDGIRPKAYYDLGYRFIPSFWGRGYATESGLASLDYGFKTLKYLKIAAAAHIKNEASNNVIRKLNMRFIEKFSIDHEPHNW